VKGEKAHQERRTARLSKEVGGARQYPTMVITLARTMAY
jgi:hypothetical protein